MKVLPKLLLTAAILCCSSLVAFSQITASRAGKLDREFGNNGIATYVATYPMGDSLTLADGSILQVLTSQISFPSSRTVVDLRKHTASGSLDPAFGTNGRKTYDLGYDAGGVAIARLADGKYLIAGGANPTGQFREHDFLIFRTHPNGELDTTFGDNGLVLKNFPSPDPTDNTMDGADALHLMPDGKILVAGTSTRYSASGQGTIFAKVIRLNPDGSTDLNYGVGGVDSSDALGNSGYVSVGVKISASLVDQTGKLIVGVAPDLQPGSGGGGPDTCRLVRWGAEGGLDAGFGQNGVKELTPGVDSRCLDIVRFPDGRTGIVTGYSLKVLRDNGSEDTSFANNGTLLFGPGLGIGDLLIVETGKMYVAGHRWVSLNPGVTYQGVIKAYHPNGAPDLRFGVLGTAILSMPDQTPILFQRLHLSETGSLIVTGAYGNPGPMLRQLITRYSFSK